MIEIKEDFKYRLEKALGYAHMKPIDLAHRTGISEATISQYRSGYSKPKDKRLVMIANCLNVNPSWLMGLDVPMIISEIDTPAASSVSPVLEYTEEDKEILTLYHALSEESRQAFRSLLKSLK